ncbi:MAG: stage II sporulation protein M [archaeon]|nr:stage II sporulation protein M [archaeon]
MVLESITSLNLAEKHPIALFFTAFIMTTIAMFVSYKLFPSSSAVLTIAFVTIVFMPLMHNMFKKEEIKEVDEKDIPFAFIATHFNVIHIYSWIFIGMIVAYTFWGVALPDNNENCTSFGCFLPAKQDVFLEQYRVHGKITGKIVGETECFNEKSKSFGSCFELIFVNNSWVMVLAIIFSLIWGAGAIFLLGWNASVIGLFLAMEITAKSLDAGIVRALGYLPHGIPEIMAYFIAAIIGGIISAAISKKTFQPHELRIVAIDTCLLLLLATITLFIGAFIETASIFNYFDAALGGIIAFAALFFILYIPGVRYKINKIRKEKI